MSGNYLLYSNGITNKFSTYSVAHVTTGGITVATATVTSGGAFVDNGTAGSVFAAYLDLWERLNDGQVGIIPSLTTTQISALSNIDDGVQVIDSTLNRLDVCIGGSFSSAGGTTGTSTNTVAYGSMYENNSSGSVTDSTAHTWITAGVGVVDSDGIITFSDNSGGDRLVVGTGGAGDYEVMFAASFTNAGGKDVTGTIYKNGVATTIIDVIEGDSSKQRNIMSYGILTLAVNDYITLHLVSATASDLVDIYHCHLIIEQLS